MKQSDGADKVYDKLNREISQHSRDGIRLRSDADEIQREHLAHHENNSPLTSKELKEVGAKIEAAGVEFDKTIDLQTQLIKKQRERIDREITSLRTAQTVKHFVSAEWLAAYFSARQLRNQSSQTSAADLEIKRETYCRIHPKRKNTKMLKRLKS